MPKSNTSEKLENEEDYDLFAGGDAREELDVTSLDRGDDPEAVVEEVVEEAEETVVEEAVVEEAEEVVEEAVVEDPVEAPESDELEVEEAEEEVEVEAVKTDEKSHMVPKSRMDEEIARRRQLEDRLAKLEDSAKPKEAEVPEFDFDTKEIEYMEAVLDGETDKAKLVRKEIREAERDAMARELRHDISNTTNVTKQQLALDVAVSDMVASYPVLDTSSELADQELIAEANELMGMYSEKGMASADALRKAVRMTLASNRPELLTPKAVETNKPAAKKRVTDVTKKLDAANKQPAKLAGESAATRGEETISISTMSDTDFQNLSEAQMKRLRGDFG
tara:strand:- start:389 stop:1396 length:1008 start_codon:yes stop_codon:yes gene_type:complete